MPSVAKAAPLPVEQVNKLLSPWFEDARLIAELPLPVIIDVKLNPDAELDAARLQQSLSRISPLIKVTSHSEQLQHFVAIARLMKGVALAVALLLIFTLVAAIGVICRAALTAHRELLELLHIMGATDGFIARQFQGFAARLSVPAALVSLGAAVLTTGIVVMLFRRLELPLMIEAGANPYIGLAVSMLCITALAVLCAILVTRFSVMRILRTMM
jgi:cell division transport system permease protein